MKWPRYLCGVDNETPDLIRLLALASIAVFLVLACWAVMHDRQSWDAQQYGVGLGAVIAAVGAALKLAQDTEPKP